MVLMVNAMCKCIVAPHDGSTTILLLLRGMPVTRNPSKCHVNNMHHVLLRVSRTAPYARDPNERSSESQWYFAKLL